MDEPSLPTRPLSIQAQREDLRHRGQVASPCMADWEQMTGDGHVRHCPECNLNVYNLSAMTVREAAHLVSSHPGRLCVRYYRGADGSILTQNQQGSASTSVRRVSRIASAALSAAMTVSFAAAQTTSQHESQQLVQLAPRESGIMVQVADATRAVFPHAQVSLLNQSSQREMKGVTDASGILRLLHLPTGSYRLTVSSQGFEHHSEVVDLREQEITTLNVTLQVGEVVQGGTVEMMPVPVAVVDSVPIPLEPVPTVEQERPGKKPWLKRMFTGVSHKVGF